MFAEDVLLAARLLLALRGAPRRDISPLMGVGGMGLSKHGAKQLLRNKLDNQTVTKLDRIGEWFSMVR